VVVAPIDDTRGIADHTADDPGPDILTTVVIRSLPPLRGPRNRQLERIDCPPEPAEREPNEGTVPIIGPSIRRGDIDGMRLFEQLPDAEKAKFAKRWQQTQPGHLEAERRKRRERIRLWITVLVFAGIVVTAGFAIYAGVIAKTRSWNEIKDWLSLAVAPLVAAATVASMFWFPSREAD
jgi:hypothetical protein